MCNKNHKSNKNKIPTQEGRYGDALVHGAAHAEDHAQWTRRDFLMRVGAASLGTSMMMAGLPVRALGGSHLFDRLALLNTDRVLVMIQLNGGNDGLNTIIPITNDLYYQNRPTIGIKAADAIKLSTDFGMNASLSGLQNVWGNAQMAVLHAVGYPSPNLSHFRATDIWLSGSSSSQVLSTGWLGRALDTDFPSYADNPTANPLAVQIGAVSSMLFQGPDATMGLTVSDVDEFYRLVSGGAVYDEKNVPSSHYGSELAFVRSVANDAVAYGGTLKKAYDAAKNTVTYPTTALAKSLAIVSRLIQGGAGARIYQVSLGGFDTHAGQLSSQATLLKTLGDAMKAFTDDLNAAGWGEKVLSMTFSEFGRRVKENGSGGTDHGTAAPMLLFGKGLQAGFHGTAPDLKNLRSDGNINYGLDFRAVYATLLQHWFGMSASEVTQVLGQTFSPLSFIKSLPTDAVSDLPLPAGFQLHANYPNPFSTITQISYTLQQATKVSIKVYDLQGRRVAHLIDQVQDAGSYTLPFNGDFLPSGTYLCRLETPHGSSTQKMSLLH